MTQFETLRPRGAASIIVQAIVAMNDRQFNPSAAVLAWLWPGVGHLYLGHRRRGRYIMFGVLLLFFGGILIGGLDSIDRKNDRLWFLAQGLNGPIAFAADWIN